MILPNWPHLNLVVVKRRPTTADLLELHPMVRQFIHQTFTTRERLSFIDAIILVYKRFISSHRSNLAERPSLTILQYWTQSADLDIGAGNYADAFLMLAEASEAFISSAYSREYSRTARRLFSSVDWVTQHAKFKGLEKVFRIHTRILSYLGEHLEVDELLDLFEKTVPDKDARYINYCELRCFSFWARGDFTRAVEWGRIGNTLEASGVDTHYTAGYSLALAERDAGLPDIALQYFLHGQNLAKVTDPDDLDEEMEGAQYGNIGRCLHFMGQIDAALICYQKSALLLERNPKSEHVLNQGFARAWIGELLLARDQFKLADVFFRAAYQKWEHISPTRAANALHLSNQVKTKIVGGYEIHDDEIEKICLDWILGRSLDRQFQ